MSKKTVIAAITIAGLLLSLVGMQFVEVAKANPFAGYLHIDPPTDAKLPVITISSPKNWAVYSSANFTFKFSVTSPETDWSMRVEEVYYVTDWLKEPTPVRYFINFFSLGGGSTSVEPTLPPFYEPKGAPSAINFSCTLSNVTEGSHYIQVHAFCEFYNNTGMSQRFYSLNATSYAYFNTSDSITPDFGPPTISNLSIENMTYNSNRIPVSFDVNEPVSQISYKLDNLSAVSISSNNTIISVPEGFHSIIVFVEDINGNVAQSDCVYFAVSIPSPSSSPTPQPTLEPSQTPTANFFSDWIPYAVIAVVVVLGVSALVYFKKRKKSEAQKAKLTFCSDGEKDTIQDAKTVGMLRISGSFSRNC